jgi:hypothetical protein
VAAYAVGLDRKETSIKEFLNLWIYDAAWMYKELGGVSKDWMLPDH